MILPKPAKGSLALPVAVTHDVAIGDRISPEPLAQAGSALARKRDQRPKGVILLVEDDHGDQLLTCEALSESALAHKVVVVSDGEEALEYLSHTGRYKDAAAAPRPDLILLDLNMPKINGRQLAAKLKGDPGLQTIPIVVLSTSDYHDDVAHCYKTGVNSYVHKPTSYDDFVATINAVEHYWLRIVQPAPRP